MAAYQQGGVDQLIPPDEYRVREMGYSKEENDEISESAAEHVEDQQQQDQDLADEHGFKPAPPEGYIDPEMEKAKAGNGFDGDGEDSGSASDSE